MNMFPIILLFVFAWFGLCGGHRSENEHRVNSTMLDSQKCEDAPVRFGDGMCLSMVRLIVMCCLGVVSIVVATLCCCSRAKRTPTTPFKTHGDVEQILMSYEREDKLIAKHDGRQVLETNHFQAA
ncbi:uncharacterized protein LOC128206412 [Mya arenaria]|uniref:uncharacterized protein LOC128206412 n=1 Tax=Mya arenaria TaxID=6604 RepID=UPI0022E45829|nr:uncharacterized protein LOC128206412 [Mya arenaria]